MKFEACYHYPWRVGEIKDGNFDQKMFFVVNHPAAPRVCLGLYLISEVCPAASSM